MVGSEEVAPGVYTTVSPGRVCVEERGVNTMDESSPVRSVVESSTAERAGRWTVPNNRLAKLVSEERSENIVLEGGRRKDRALVKERGELRVEGEC